MDDPNADIIGESITVEGTTFTVTGTAPWSNSYVYVRSDDGKNESCAVAEYVRAAKEGCRCVYPDKCFCPKDQAA